MSVQGSIAGVGMSTPLGLDARQSALLLRARKLSPDRTSFHDGRGLAVGDVRARRLDDALVGRARLIELAAPALAEAARAIAPGEPLPLFLSVPARRAAAEEPLGADFLDALAHRAGVSIALDRSEAIPAGQAGFAVALQRGLAAVSARVPLDAHRAARPFALVGGVDSHHDPAVLAALDEERRLHAEGVANGIIPSEAAAFLLLGPARPPSEPSRAAPAYARVTAVAVGMEREDDDENPPVGEAATEAVRAAAAAFPGLVPWVLCDVNGERHRVKEWSFARIRNPDRFDAGKTVETRPYDELGDVGAATGAVYAAHVAMAFHLGFAPARSALVALASEDRLRGAFALEAP